MSFKHAARLLESGDESLHCLGLSFDLTHDTREHAIPYLVAIDTTRMRLSKRHVV